jgi:hypothetical protein
MARELAIKIMDKTGTSSTGGTGTGAKSGGAGGFGGMALKLGALLGAVLSLKDVLAPILKLLQVMMTVVFLPLVMVLVSLLRPVLLLALRWFRRNDKDLFAGINLAGEGAETLATGEGSEIMTDYIKGLTDVNKNTDIFSRIMASLGIILAPVVALFSGLKSIFSGEFFSKEYWSKVKDGVVESWDRFKNSINELIINPIVAKWQEFKNLIQTLIIEPFLEKWNLFKELIQTSIIDPIISKWNDFKVGLDIIWATLKTVWGKFTSGLDTIWTTLTDVWGKFTSGLDTIWTSLTDVWEKFTSGLDTIWVNLKSAFDSVIGAIKSAWRSVKNLFRSSSKDDGGKQHGGDILKTGRYLLHKGERVIPETQTNGLSGGTVNVNITGSVNDNNLAEIIRQVSKEMRRAGAW